jgi:hypothetical protein
LRCAGYSPHRATMPGASHAPPTAIRPIAILLVNVEERVRTKILYFDLESVRGKYVDSIRQRGHDVTAVSSGAEALAMMRGQIFDALVRLCARYVGHSELLG